MVSVVDGGLWLVADSYSRLLADGRYSNQQGVPIRSSMTGCSLYMCMDVLGSGFKSVDTTCMCCVHVYWYVYAKQKYICNVCIGIMSNLRDCSVYAIMSLLADSVST